MQMVTCRHYVCGPIRSDTGTGTDGQVLFTSLTPLMMLAPSITQVTFFTPLNLLHCRVVPYELWPVS